MKVFWWQAGLHLEPETNEEREALVSLVNSVKMVDTVKPHFENLHEIGSEACVQEKSLELFS